MQAETIIALLENWGRWLRAGHGAKGHCFSIEGRYRSPQCWYPPEPREPEGDALEALRVDRVMHLLPSRHRKALELRYVRRLPVELVAKRIAVSSVEIEEFMARAVIMLGNILTIRERRAILQRITALSGHAEINTALGSGVGA